MRSSVNPANAGSSRISASETFRESWRSGTTSTNHDPRVSCGSGSGAETTRTTPTQARTSPLW